LLKEAVLLKRDLFPFCLHEAGRKGNHPDIPQQISLFGNKFIRSLLIFNIVGAIKDSNPKKA